MDAKIVTMLPLLTISTDKSLLDLDVIEHALHESYWAKGRRRAVIEKSIENSLCFGVYATGKQIAFARVITDRAVFGYLSDVFVVPEFRGQGIGKTLVRTILEHDDIKGLALFLLRTRDAQGLYAQFGFDTVGWPDELMARSTATVPD
jgi:GNAT superfamily N-acetyltransferase